MVKEMKSNLDCNWNHRGDKFCIGSGSGNVYLGTFFAENNFWVAHPLKKKALHKSSVVCVRFDPLSGRVIASASLDGTVQITSAYKEELDTDSAGPFGQVTSYGDTLLSVSSNGWINHLAFSPSSSTLCCLIVSSTSPRQLVNPRSNLRKSCILATHTLIAYSSKKTNSSPVATTRSHTCIKSKAPSGRWSNA